MHRMDTKKRRVVYFTDEEWETAKERAASYDLSVSAYLRNLVIGGLVTPESLRKEFREIAARPSPYAAFRPVPKPR